MNYFYDYDLLIKFEYVQSTLNIDDFIANSYMQGGGGTHNLAIVNELIVDHPSLLSKDFTDLRNFFF